MRKLDILNELNEGQREAVKHINGPALTTATAGAGKTKVIVTRTQYMILEGVSPSQILLTTFTNKAANEIKKRIVDVVGEQGKFVTVGTFHSICNKILRQYSDKSGYNRNFTILDDSVLYRCCVIQYNSVCRCICCVRIAYAPTALPFPPTFSAVQRAVAFGAARSLLVLLSNPFSAAHSLLAPAANCVSIARSLLAPFSASPGTLSSHS